MAELGVLQPGLRVADQEHAACRGAGDYCVCTCCINANPGAKVLCDAGVVTGVKLRVAACGDLLAVQAQPSTLFQKMGQSRLSGTPIAKSAL